MSGSEGSLRAVDSFKFHVLRKEGGHLPTVVAMEKDMATFFATRQKQGIEGGRQVGRIAVPAANGSASRVSSGAATTDGFG